MRAIEHETGGGMIKNKVLRPALPGLPQYLAPLPDEHDGSGKDQQEKTQESPQGHIPLKSLSIQHKQQANPNIRKLDPDQFCGNLSHKLKMIAIA